MFTGITEHLGKVVTLSPSGGGATLRIDTGPLAKDSRIGASIAVNGTCLTISGINQSVLSFDVVAETLTRSTLGQLRAGDHVNLERALAIGDRLGGHFVQGHIDGLARLVRRAGAPSEMVFWFDPDAALRAYIVPKGSVALDGVSLTIAEVIDNRFSVAIIPTTLTETNLGRLREGDTVNVETDILVRTVVHTLGNISAGGGITLDKLGEHGFL